VRILSPSCSPAIQIATTSRTILRCRTRPIEAEGIGAVSLRRVTRELRSAPAPYHHFAGRAALLAAISAQRYELLEQQLRQARRRAPAAPPPTASPRTDQRKHV
jgi:AcrR family transcriptional regulator